MIEFIQMLVTRYTGEVVLGVFFILVNLGFAFWEAHLLNQMREIDERPLVQYRKPQKGE